MSYGYKVRAHKNLKTQETLYYPSTAPLAPLSINQIASEISEKCTLTRADLMAVLVELQTQIKNVILQGQTVRLGNLGSFRATVKCEAKTSKDDLNTKLISQVCCKFISSVWMKNRLKKERLKFKRESLK